MLFPQQYQDIEKIAQGGSAEIYRATIKGSSGLGDFSRTVALKRVLPHQKLKTYTSMLIDEANLLVSLNHPNIVRVYDLDCKDEVYFLVMEYVDGCDLRGVMRYYRKKRVNAESLLPLDFAVLIACEVCKALSYAHEKVSNHFEPMNLVHMDISPRNILLSQAGEVKVTDFGIAKIQPKALAQGAKRTQVIRGKFSYMSPEQALGLSVDARSDIFSLGIVLYEMITGERLYQSDRIIDLQKEHREKTATAPLLSPAIPEELEYIVLKCLAYDPEVRFASAHLLYKELLRFLFLRLRTIPHQQIAFMMEEVLSGDVATPPVEPEFKPLRQQVTVEKLSHAIRDSIKAKDHLEHPPINSEKEDTAHTLEETLPIKRLNSQEEISTVTVA